MIYLTKYGIEYSRPSQKSLEKINLKFKSCHKIHIISFNIWKLRVTSGATGSAIKLQDQIAWSFHITFRDLLQWEQKTNNATGVWMAGYRHRTLTLDVIYIYELWYK